MAPLSYPLFFFRKHSTCHTNNYMGKRNNCISLRIYLWKMPCGKCWKWHCRETKFRNFLEEHPSLKCLQRSNFSSRAYTFKISRYASVCSSIQHIYLTIIPRARMGSESIAHEAEGRMGYWLRGYEGERNNCFSKIQIVGKKYGDKTTLASKTRFSHHYFGFQSRRFSLLMGYNIKPSSSSTNQNADRPH